LTLTKVKMDGCQRSQAYRAGNPKSGVTSV